MFCEIHDLADANPKGIIPCHDQEHSKINGDIAGNGRIRPTVDDDHILGSFIEQSDPSEPNGGAMGAVFMVIENAVSRQHVGTFIENGGRGVDG